MLRRCFSTLGCPDLGLEEVLALAVEHRITAIELRALGGGLDLAGYLGRQFGTPAKFGAEVTASGVEVVALNASLHLGAPTDAGRAELLALAPWADAAGAKWLRVFDGAKTAGPVPLTDLVAALRWWRAQRAAHGWRSDVMVETHDTLLTAERLREFARLAPDTPILWDAHHTWRKGGEDPVITWETARALAVHIHVKDSIGVPSGRHPFTYVLPGDGEFPMARLREAWARENFSGRVSLEWEKLWHPALPPLGHALTVAAARDWW